MERNWKRFYIEGVLRDKWNELSPEQKARLDAIGFNREKRIRHREVTCFETGERFPYVKHVALSVGCSEGRVRSAIVRRTPINGFHFYYSDEGKPSSDSFRKLLYGRPVICFETGEKFSTSGVVAERYGVTSNRVIDAIKKRHSVGEEQLHFYFADEPMPKIEDFSKPLRRKVACIENGTIYSSATAAARDIGANVNNVTRSCKKGLAVCGLHFHYSDESAPTIKKRRGKPIRCLESGKVYTSAKDASKDVGIPVRLIVSAACRKGGGTEGDVLLHWMYEEDFASSDSVRRSHARRRRVRCKETGEVFDSMKDASSQLKVNYSSISACCRGSANTAGGYHWEYVDD